MRTIPVTSKCKGDWNGTSVEDLFSIYDIAQLSCIRRSLCLKLSFAKFANFLCELMVAQV